MTAWTDVGAIAELNFAPGAAVKVGDTWVAIFRLDGGYRAVDNPCPHAGAPLCDGTVFAGKVACFLHCWEFDLTTGACDVGEAWNVRTWAVREEGGHLFVAPRT